MTSNFNHKLKLVVVAIGMFALISGCRTAVSPTVGTLVDRDLKNSTIYTNLLAGDLEFLPVLPHRGETLAIPQSIAIVSISPNGRSAATRSSGDVTLVVTSGIGVLTSQIGIVNLVPGKAVYIPAGTVFTLTNTTEEPVRFFRIVNPADADVEYLPEVNP